MKFSQLLLFTILGLLKFITGSNLQKNKKNPSQGTRNYRKVAADPSLNPLPSSWETGPRNNFGGGHNHEKYQSYSGKLANHNQYHDTTRQLFNHVQ